MLGVVAIFAEGNGDAIVEGEAILIKGDLADIVIAGLLLLGKLFRSASLFDYLRGVLFCLGHDARDIWVDDRHAAALPACVGTRVLLLVVGFV